MNGLFAQTMTWTQGVSFALSEIADCLVLHFCLRRISDGREMSGESKTYLGSRMPFL